jgi:biopolymer transport protein ExbD
MNIKRRKHFKPEVSTSSLNDIMFFLLLFFLIVSTLANPNVIKLLLPSSKAAQTLNKQQITISDIEPLIQTKIKAIKEPTIILRLENSLSVQDLVDVLEIGTRLKVKMVLATTKKEGS